jgi:hypothetical protein
MFGSDPTAAVEYTESKTEPKEAKENVYGKAETPPSTPRKLTPWRQMIEDLVDTGCNDETYKEVWRLARSQVCSKCGEFQEKIQGSIWDKSYLIYEEEKYLEGVGCHGPITQICKKYGEMDILFADRERKPVNLKGAKQLGQET